MIGDLARREDELGGKTLLIVGLGRIGGRLARLAKAFDMHVIGAAARSGAGPRRADEVHGMDALTRCCREADIVALTCPLTPETENLIDAAALARDEAIRLPGQRRARPLRRRGGADRGARRAAASPARRST